jgi:hypothetical protein
MHVRSQYFRLEKWSKDCKSPSRSLSRRSCFPQDSQYLIGVGLRGIGIGFNTSNEALLSQGVNHHHRHASPRPVLAGIRAFGLEGVGDGGRMRSCRERVAWIARLRLGVVALRRDLRRVKGNEVPSLRFVVVRAAVAEVPERTDNHGVRRIRIGPLAVPLLQTRGDQIHVVLFPSAGG